jgi:glyoxylase-like metal-dependent hydrolase (beta-lactamase superfamily II)
MTLSVRIFNTGYTPVNGGPGWDGRTTATWPSSTATLIIGAHDAILVDALMTTAQGRELVSWIGGCEKNLTDIVVTHGHGDHFFGAGPVLRAYPAARLLALNDDVIAEARLHLQSDILSNWIGWFGDQFDHAAAIPEKFGSEVLEVEGTPLNWLAVGGADGPRHRHTPGRAGHGVRRRCRLQQHPHVVVELHTGKSRNLAVHHRRGRRVEPAHHHRRPQRSRRPR